MQPSSDRPDGVAAREDPAPYPPGRAGDVLIAGTPGRLLSWICDLLTAAMVRGHGNVVHVMIGSEPWRIPGPETAGEPRLFIGDFVNEDWARLVRSSVLPAVLLVDDIAWAWDHLFQAGQSPIESVRNIIAVTTALGDLVSAERVLMLGRRDWADPGQLAARIAAHAGLPIDGVHWDADIPASPPSVPSEWRPVIEGAVAPAFRYGASGSRSPLTWSRDCFYWGDRLGEAPPRVLDLTGPARALVYGPYFAVPAGAWTVRATLAFSPLSCAVPLALEVHGPAQIGRFAFAAEQPGVFAASLPVVVPSGRQPLEVRLLTERGAIEGTMGFDQVELIPT